MKIDKRQVGLRIKTLRHSKNMTLSDVAEMVHAKGKSTVNSWERGATLPRDKFMTKLCSLFGVSKNYILFGSLDDYLISLVLSDYISDDSITHFEISNYMNYTSNRLDFINSIPLNFSPDEDPEAIISDADCDEVKKILKSNLTELKTYLGKCLKYNNDYKILQLVAKWFRDQSAYAMDSFMGQYRHLKNFLSLYVPTNLGLGNVDISNENVSLVASHFDMKPKEALDAIFNSKMGELQLAWFKDLDELKEEYQEQLKSLTDDE